LYKCLYCREKKKEALTLQHIDSITQQISQLKEQRKACNSECSPETARMYEEKLNELKSELEESKKKFKELENTRKENLSKIMDDHKEQLKEYDNVVKAQSTEIRKCTKVINEFKQKAEIIEVKFKIYSIESQGTFEGEIDGIKRRE